MGCVVTGGLDENMSYVLTTGTIQGGGVRSTEA
jgi:hypothetical protein